MSHTSSESVEQGQLLVPEPLVTKPLVTEPLVSPQPPTWGTRVQQVWQQMTSQWQQQFQQAQQTYAQVQQHQAAFETQLETNIGKLATTVAHREQQIKRQVKQFLIKTAEKL
jgi:hypothetical protein